MAPQLRYKIASCPKQAVQDIDRIMATMGINAHPTVLLGLNYCRSILAGPITGPKHLEGTFEFVSCLKAIQKRNDTISYYHNPSRQVYYIESGSNMKQRILKRQLWAEPSMTETANGRPQSSRERSVSNTGSSSMASKRSTPVTTPESSPPMGWSKLFQEPTEYFGMPPHTLSKEPPLSSI